jgi:hypothetical protein
MFKKQSVEDLDSEVKQAEKTMRKGGKSYTGFATVQKGKNTFRVAPSMGKAYVACKMSKLHVEVPTYDENGNVTGKEVKDKNIFCADVHGRNLLKGKDPIVLYCDYARKKASEEYQDDTERRKYLNPIMGYKKGNKFVWGINPTLAYVCYVYQGNKDFARLQLYGTWMNRIKEISVEQSDDDTVSFDIFSQMEGAYPLVITMGEDDKGKKTYSLSAGIPKKGQSWDEFFEETAIPDEDMEYFLNEVPSLEEIYKDSYRTKDFEMALDGLKRFDEENNYDIFSDDEFLNEIEEMAAMLPDDSQSEEDKKTPFDEDEDEEEKLKKKTVAKKPAKKEDEEEKLKKKTVAKKPAKEEDEEEKPAPKKQVVKAPASEKAAKVASYPPLSKMKAFLSQYIDEEYPGMEIPSDLTITKLREWYDLAQKGEALPFPEGEEEDTEQEHETEYDDDRAKDEPEKEDGEDERPEEEESPIDEGQTDNDEKLLEAKKRLQALKARMKKK